MELQWLAARNPVFPTLTQHVAQAGVLAVVGTILIHRQVPVWLSSPLGAQSAFRPVDSNSSIACIHFFPLLKNWAPQFPTINFFWGGGYKLFLTFVVTIFQQHYSFSSASYYYFMALFFFICLLTGPQNDQILSAKNRCGQPHRAPLF